MGQGQSIDDEIVLSVAKLRDESELTALLREGFSQNQDVTVIDNKYY